MTENTSAPRIIYIGGAEHNGSTFLGVALNNHSQVTCVGELSEIPREGWNADFLCACGLRILECNFWTKVRKTWERTVNGSIDELLALEDAFDRNRRLPHVIVNKYIPTQEFSKYGLYTYALFSAVQQVSGNSIIVDTSKRFSRALAISTIEGIDFRLIHLVRDARGVAYSWTKPYRAVRKGLWDASLRWSVANEAFELVRRLIGEEKVLTVRYEDLISKPYEMLNEIGNFTGLDFSSVARIMMRGDPLSLGHMGIGNDFLRREKSVKLQSRIDWPHKMSRVDQRKVWLLTSWGMCRYGYKP